MKGLRDFFKAGLFFAIAALSMGNESCDQFAGESGERVLKKRALVGQIQTRPMNIEGGGQFDFAFVANMQLYNLINESERYVMPRLEKSTSHGAMLSSADYKVYSGWQSKAKSIISMKGSKEAECLLHSPQVKIGGSIRSFEFKSKGGLDFGLGPGSDLGYIPRAAISVTTAALNLGLEVEDAINGTILAASEASSNQTKTKINLKLDFGSFSLGPSFYFESPLADVTHRALSKVINDLTAQLDDEPWTSRVIERHDTHLVILGGRRSGIQVGDQFEIYNESHHWRGEPCNSDYLGGVPTTQEPVAVIEISHLGEDIAHGRVIEQTLINPVLGAKVKWVQQSSEQ